jgi:hypothetical protein
VSSSIFYNILYCYVSWVPWLIITGSRLDDWIYWRLLLQIQPIITAHNQWLRKSRSILLHCDGLLFHCDWLGSDLRVGHFFSFRCPLANTPQLNIQLMNSELSCKRRIMAYLRMTNQWRLNYWTAISILLRLTEFLIWVWVLRYDRRSVGQSSREPNRDHQQSLSWKRV